MRLDRSLNMLGTMLFLACCAAPGLECQAPPPAAKADPAPPQTAPADGQQQKPSDTEQRRLADKLLENANQVDQIVDQNLTDREREALKTALDQIQVEVQTLQSIIVTQPPVKVRGGAMTVRTTRLIHDGDSETVGGVSRKFDCVVLNPDLTAHPLELQFIEDPTVQGWTPQQKFGPLKGNETIDLLGRSNATILIPEGIRLQFTHSCKVSGVDHFGVTIKPVVPGSKSFYEFRDHDLDEDGITYIKRFQHPGCKSLPDPNGDEDTCEQMSDIKINGGSSWAHCTNGECLVQIVQY